MKKTTLNILTRALAILSDNCLKVNVQKCIFFQNSITFLGYQISATGIRPPTDKVVVISKYPLPQSSSDLRRFMGMINFFRQMIPHFSDITYPVTELLRSSPASKQIIWTDSAIASLEKLKLELADCLTLSYPSPETNNYQLVTDASGFAAGAALYQMIDGNPTRVGFYSKKNFDAQKSHTTENC